MLRSSWFYWVKGQGHFAEFGIITSAETWAAEGACNNMSSRWELSFKWWIEAGVCEVMVDVQLCRIAVELVRSVGRYTALCPVIESLFHRIFLYHAPMHRLEAIKSVQPVIPSYC